MPSAVPSTETESPAKTRPWIGFVVKVVVTVTLVVWLVRSGGLNFAALRLLWTSPTVAVSALFNFGVGVVVCSAWRWRLVLGVLGQRLSVRRALGLQTIAVFFNFFVPGNVSGDLIKNHAVAQRDAGRLVAVTLVERVTGVVGLVWAAVPALLWARKDLSALSGGGELLFFMSFLFVMSLVSLAFLRALLLRMIPKDTGQAPSEAPPGSSRLGRLVQNHLQSGTKTLRLVAEQPSVVVKAIFISVAMHCVAMVNFLIIARSLGNTEASFAQVALVYPIGILSVIVPVSISGMGVGHVLFNELFKMLGLARGADVFNVHIFSGLLPSLIGAVPYLSMKVRARVDATETP